MRYIYAVLLSLFAWSVGGSTLFAQSESLSHQDDMACPHCRHKAMEAQEKGGESAQPQVLRTKAQAPTRTLVTTFKSGQVYRLKSMRNQYLRENDQHSCVTGALSSGADFAAAWILEKSGQGYTLRNANTGRLLQDSDKDEVQLTTSTNAVEFYIRKSNKHAGKYQLSWKTDFSGKNCLHEASLNRVVRWRAEDHDTYSNWTIEEASNITPAQVRQHLAANSSYASDITSGKTYRFVNAAYGDYALTVDYFTGEVSAKPTDKGALGQVWKVESVSGKWKISSVVSGDNILDQRTRSAAYTAGDREFAFRMVKHNNWTTSFAFGGTFFLHTDQGRSVVAWYDDQPASRWYLEPVEVNAEELKQAKEHLTSTKELAKNAESISTKLGQFFADKACTKLVDAYAGVSNEALVAAMKNAGLPEQMQQMAVRVKTGMWQEHVEANRLEKDFRIADYQAYSDHIKWHQGNLVGTGFRFSRLTSPTGITVDAGQSAYIFVDQAAPVGCTLAAELVQGFNTTGHQIPLKPGFNVVSALEPAHIYIYYNVDNVQKKLADCPNIKIHIEGGRTNGYFDASRHSNEDWTLMKRLGSLGYLKDETLRLKSTYYCMSLHLDQAKASEARGDWSYRGVYRGLTGILGKMDAINKMERELIGAAQYYDRFNCMHFASSNGQHDFLYATNYGIYLKNAGTFLNYKTYTEGRENYGGGDLWAVAHETGHHFQRLFDLTVCVESSVNLFSNIAVFNQGSNVSRGPSMLHFVDQFNKNVSWIDRTLADRILPYYQLWLYFEHLGHHPNFYKELCDKFRVSPIEKGDANTDYLKFARTVCDVVQEDLTEFFEFHGFLNKTKVGNQKMTWGDPFYDKYYGPKPISISASSIDATRRHMAKYDKKSARNLLFIDDRIRKYAATHEGARNGQMKWGTTDKVFPGVPNSVGEVGMFHDFAKDATTATITEAKLTGRTVHVKGSGIVGYKVYDAHGRLAYVSNRNTFILPTTLDLAKLEVKVGAGNGDEITIIKEGRVLDKFVLTGIVETEIDAPASVHNATDTPVYDLTGRRVQPTQGGIYIQAGKIKIAR